MPPACLTLTCLVDVLLLEIKDGCSLKSTVPDLKCGDWFGDDSFMYRKSSVSEFVDENHNWKARVKINYMVHMLVLRGDTVHHELTDNEFENLQELLRGNHRVRRTAKQQAVCFDGGGQLLTAAPIRAGMPQNGDLLGEETTTDLQHETTPTSGHERRFLLGDTVRLVQRPTCCGALIQHYKSYENWIDMTWILLANFCAFNWLLMLWRARSFSIEKVYDLRAGSTSQDETDERFSELLDQLQSLTALFTLYRIAAGGLLLTSSIKFAFQLGMYPPMLVIVRTVVGAVATSIMFLAAFVLIVVQFGLVFHIYIGTVFEDFSKLSSSIQSCLQMLTGIFDSGPLLQYANRESLVFVLFCFYSFQIIMVWILINIFIGIMMQSYGKAKTIYENGDDSHMSSLIDLYSTPWTWMSNPVLYRLNMKHVQDFIDDMNLYRSLNARAIDLGLQSSELLGGRSQSSDPPETSDFKATRAVDALRGHMHDVCNENDTEVRRARLSLWCIQFVLHHFALSPCATPSFPSHHMPCTPAGCKLPCLKVCARLAF